ncbi:MAG: hypothetical protein GY853_10055 [PVC group bacterium]|nr:hypothetical protein [PVC group bacterium]
MNTLKEVLDTITRQMPLYEQVKFRETKEEDLIMYHFGLGRQIRNSFKLWEQNLPLLKDMDLPFVIHADEVSQKIIIALWNKLNEEGK